MTGRSTILYLDHAPVWGGAEAVLVALARRLDQERFRPLVATPAASPLAVVSADQGVAVVPVTYGHLRRLAVASSLEIPRTVCEVARAVRGNDVDLIHSNTARTHAYAAAVGALTQVPVVWTLHDTTLPSSLIGPLSRVPKRVITVSDGVRAHYQRRLRAQRAVTIHNGVAPRPPAADGAATRRLLGVPADAPLVLHVGRLVRPKAAHRFVRAAAVVSTHRPDVRFVVVGGADPGDLESTSYAEELRRTVERAGAGEAIRLVGHRDDVDQLYAAADLFVYTASEPEALPTVILEAMSHGLPVVASDLGGAAEIITDRRTGRLVPPDDEAALVEVLLALLADRQERVRLAAAGAALVRDEYSLDRQVRRVEELYLEVLGTSAG